MQAMSINFDGDEAPGWHTCKSSRRKRERNNKKIPIVIVIKLENFVVTRVFRICLSNFKSDFFFKRQ